MGLDHHRLSGIGHATHWSGALEDFGAEASFVRSPDSGSPAIFSDPSQTFAKFLGQSGNRAELSHVTLDELNRTGCHWAVAYPKADGKRRPTRIQDGAVMFISRLVKGPDIRDFGHAIATRHQTDRHDATPDDIDLRPWKSRWPRYIRVHHAEIVAGTMESGVSLSTLMDALGSDSFASTQGNTRQGHGNTNPRRAFIRQPDVKLTGEAVRWLNERLQTAFVNHGRIARHELKQLDWSDVRMAPREIPEFTQDTFDHELRRMFL